MELTELYQAKGFTGKLLEEVVDVLMADENRLLRVMLEEELGLTLEAYEHPLKQSMGAALGVSISALLALLALYVYPSFGLPLVSLLSIAGAAWMSARLERNLPLPAIVWSLSIAGFAGGSLYLLLRILGL
jgi:VIT1/CCC1 family predicted Fe2+/Mn2+ transporter